MMPQTIDKVGLVYIKDKKVLVAKSFGHDKFYIPGGKREAGETDEQTLMREIKEELSVEVLPETIKLYGVYETQATNKPEGTMIRAACYTAELSGEPSAGNEIETLDVLSYDRKDEVGNAAQLLFDDLRQKGLID